MPVSAFLLDIFSARIKRLIISTSLYAKICCQDDVRGVGFGSVVTRRPVELKIRGSSPATAVHGLRVDLRNVPSFIVSFQPTPDLSY